MWLDVVLDIIHLILLGPFIIYLGFIGRRIPEYSNLFDILILIGFIIVAYYGYKFIKVLSP